MEPAPLLAARLECSASDGIQWTKADAVHTVHDAANERIRVQKGAAAAMTPLTLEGKPDLSALVAAVGFEDLRAARAPVWPSPGGLFRNAEGLALPEWG